MESVGCTYGYSRAGPLAARASHCDESVWGHPGLPLANFGLALIERKPWVRIVSSLWTSIDHD